jgi:hypothetical protein
MTRITVLAPDYEAAPPVTITPAPRRPLGAAPHRVTLIENGKPNAQVLLSAIANELRARIPGIEVDVHSKPSAGRSIDDADAVRIAARSHLVITGLGD